jgi:hypothetical protein
VFEELIPAITTTTQSIDRETFLTESRGEGSQSHL